MDDLLSLTADIVGAHVANNTVSPSELPILIKATYDSLATVSQAPTPEVPAQEPAVPIRSSVKPDYIVCLEDGKKLKMLKRYLRTNYNMTPGDYQAKWGLKADYPMVAPNYAETRKALAYKIGLGRKTAVAPESAAQAASKTRGRKTGKTVKGGFETPAAVPEKAPRKSAKAALEASRELLG